MTHSTLFKIHEDQKIYGKTIMLLPCWQITGRQTESLTAQVDCKHASFTYRQTEAYKTKTKCNRRQSKPAEKDSPCKSAWIASFLSTECAKNTNNTIAKFQKICTFKFVACHATASGSS